MACKPIDPARSLDFQLLFEALPGAFLALASDQTILAATERCCELCGLQRAVLLDRPLFELFPGAPGILPPSEAIVVQRAGHTFRGTSTPVNGPDGQLQYLLLHLEPLPTDDAATRSLPAGDAIPAGTTPAIPIETSITNRKRVFAMLWQLPAAIAILRGPDMVFEFANPRYQQLVGTARTLIGIQLTTAVPDVDQSIQEILRNVYTSGERFIGEEYPITLDWDYNGKPYRKYLNFVYEPLYDAADQVDGIFVFAYDVDAQVVARQREALLADASAALTSSLDYEETLRVVARLAVPIIADLCFFDVLGDDAELQRVAVAEDAALPIPAGDTIQRYVPTLAHHNHPVIQSFKSGATVQVNEIDDAYLQHIAINDEHLAFIQQLNVHAFMSVPVVAREHIIGVLSFLLCKPGRRFTSDDHELAEELAYRSALAIENTRLFAAEQRARLEAERRLAELTAVIDSMTDAVYIGGPNGLAMCNGPALAQLGFASLEELNHEVASLAEQIQTRNAATGQRIPPERESFTLALGGQPDTSEVIIRHQQTGEDRVVRCAAAPVRLNGSIIGAVAVNTDITERKVAERERIALLKREQAARAEAEAAVKAREEFLSVAAHELNTPLTSLRGFSEVLLRQFAGDRVPHPARVRESVDAIYQQSLKLSRFVEQLLDITRITGGRLKLRPHPTYVSNLVRDVVANLRPLAGQRRIDIDVVHEVVAILDPLRIEQVLINLLTNALKFSPEGEAITVRVEPAPNMQARIVVVDRGVGVAPEHRPFIFDQFYQAQASSRYGGLGLGLAISQSVVHLHGGTIAAEFPAEGGTRMVVTLPLVPPTG